MRLLAVLLLAGALACCPGAAFAQSPSNPLAPGLPQPQATIPTTTTPAQPAVPQVTNTTSSSGGSLGGSGVVAIAIGALVVLGGISYFIWWDARKRAPVRSRAAAIAAGDPGRRAGSKARAKPRQLSPAERRRRKRGRAR